MNQWAGWGWGGNLSGPAFSMRNNALFSNYDFWGKELTESSSTFCFRFRNQVSVFSDGGETIRFSNYLVISEIFFIHDKYFSTIYDQYFSTELNWKIGFHNDHVKFLEIKGMDQNHVRSVLFHNERDMVNESWHSLTQTAWNTYKNTHTHTQRHSDTHN